MRNENDLSVIIVTDSLENFQFQNVFLVLPCTFLGLFSNLGTSIMLYFFLIESCRLFWWGVFLSSDLFWMFLDCQLWLTSLWGSSSFSVWFEGLSSSAGSPCWGHSLTSALGSSPWESPLPPGPGPHFPSLLTSLLLEACHPAGGSAPLPLGKDWGTLSL